MIVNKPIRVVIADDHEIFRDGLKLMLKKENNIEIVGEAQNGVELVHIVNQLQPDIVLTDIVMPEMNGIEAVIEIMNEHPYIGIIALSMSDEEKLVVDILEAGATGYLIKTVGKAEILEAIITVNRKMPYFCASISSKMTRLISKSNFNPYKNKAAATFKEKEIEIINYICEGLTSKDISEKVYLSIRTVEGYRQKIMEKMDTNTTAGIIIYAIKNGIYKI
jgi:DNA-binding NarL/FixJ family response regulator